MGDEVHNDAIIRLREFITERTPNEPELTRRLADLAMLQRFIERHTRPFPPPAPIENVTEKPDPVRVEIKEAANGKTQVSVRLTGEKPEEVRKDVLALYWSTRDELDEGGIQ